MEKEAGVRRMVTAFGVAVALAMAFGVAAHASDIFVRCESLWPFCG